jgi:signal transduction histidine kinase
MQTSLLIDLLLATIVVTAASVYMLRRGWLSSPLDEHDMESPRKEPVDETQGTSSNIESSDQITSEFTHELRSQLLILKGYSEILGTTNIDREQRRRIFDNIRTAAKRTAGIAEQFESLYTIGDEASDMSSHAIPLKLRDQIIGVIHFNSAQTDRKWSEDEIALAQAISERTALALENARLFSEASKNAERERVIADITSKISSATNIESILQTTIRELKEALPKGEDIMIQLEEKKKID